MKRCNGSAPSASRHLPGVPPSRDVIQQILDEGDKAYSLGVGRLIPHGLQSNYEPGTIVALPRA
ncbi:MAG: hypothetical protein ABR606_10420 [Vicinamibacterales bacterium]